MRRRLIHSPLKIALIGCGDHARQQHAASLARWAKEHPDKIELVAACDPNQKRAAEVCEQFGFAQSFSDMQQMLDRVSPDACVSVPPVHLNASIGIELLERKIPCVIEKPPGTSMQEVNQLAEVAHRTRTPHMISMNRRFNPHLNAAFHWFKPFGPLKHIFAKMYRVRRTEAEFIWATGIHLIDTVNYLGGKVSEFTHNCSQRNSRIDVQFETGVIADLDIRPEHGAFEETYVLVGDDHLCRIRIDDRGAIETLGWIDDNLVMSMTSGDHEPREIICGAYAETDHFITSLLAGRRLSPTIDQTLPSIEIAFTAIS
jgi:predicted dehydrogenase